MKRIILRVAVALLTFTVGVGGAYLVWRGYSRRNSTEAPLTRTAVVGSPVETSFDGAAVETRATVSLEDGWARLTNSNFCFFGSNMYSAAAAGAAPHAVGDFGPPFSPYGWMPSLKEDEAAGVAFLIRQIPDRTQTQAHVDPLGMATRGELAVYCLQQIMKVNWYELKPDYRTRLDRALARDPGQSQDTLQRIIGTRAGAKEMMSLWADYYEQHKEHRASANE